MTPRSPLAASPHLWETMDVRKAQSARGGAAHANRAAQDEGRDHRHGQQPAGQSENSEAGRPDDEGAADFTGRAGERDAEDQGGGESALSRAGVLRARQSAKGPSHQRCRPSHRRSSEAPGPPAPHGPVRRASTGRTGGYGAGARARRRGERLRPRRTPLADPGTSAGSATARRPGELATEQKRRPAAEAVLLRVARRRCHNGTPPESGASQNGGVPPAATSAPSGNLRPFDDLS